MRKSMTKSTTLGGANVGIRYFFAGIKFYSEVTTWKKARKKSLSFIFL
jgi:hypothetical protein